MGKKLKLDKRIKRNSITFIKDITEKSSDGHRMCLLKCHCENEFKCITTRFNNGNIISCGCKSRSKTAIIRKVWNDPDYPFYVIFKRMEKGDKKRKHHTFQTITIDATYLKQIWEQQQGKCFYTGIQLILPKSFPESHNPLSPSIDRIDSSKGYIPDNIQIVHKQANFMKQSLSHDEFITFCKLISSRF